MKSFRLSLDLPRLLLLVSFVLGTSHGVKIRNQRPESFQSGRTVANARFEEGFDHSDLRDLQVTSTCNLNQQRQLSASVVVEFYGEPHLLSEQEADAVGSALLGTYNGLTRCTGQSSRRLTSYQLVTNLNSYPDIGERYFTLEYRVQGSCQGCRGEVPLLLDYDFIADSCPCQGPSEKIFNVGLNERIEALIASRTLRNIWELWMGAELENLSQCPAFSEFTTSDVVVELFGCPTDLTDAHLQILASTFVDTYNRINKDYVELCDPNFREIKSAVPFLDTNLFHRRRTKSQDGDGIERFTGKTRNILRHSVPKIQTEVEGGKKQSSRRRLYFDDDGWFSDGGGGDSGGGDDGLFGRADDDDSFSGGGDSGGGDDGLFGRADDDDSFSGGGDGGGDTSFDGTEDDDSLSGGGGGGGVVDDDFLNGSEDDDSLSGGGGVENDDFFSGADDNFSVDDDAFFNNTGDCLYWFEVLLDVTARCRGCNTDSITIFDEFQDVNFFGGFDDDNFGSRDLKAEINHYADEEVSYNGRSIQESECRCSVDPEYRAVTESEMFDAYAITLEILADQGKLPLSISLEDIIEVEKVQCTPEQNNFKTSVSLSFGTDNTDGTVSQETLNALSSGFQRSYNDLVQRYCDPLFRSVERIQVNPGEVIPARRALRQQNKTSTTLVGFNFAFIFKFTFYITGICRGCPNLSLLFDDASRRQLSFSLDTTQHSRFFDENNYRRMQNGGSCYCAAVSSTANSAPTDREFTERYSLDVQNLYDTGSLTNRYVISSFEEENTGATSNVRKECDTDADCIASGAGSLCVSNECLNEGNPRVTLTWFGDDDLDLSVFTPSGDQIWYLRDYDEKTKGVFDTGFSQDVEADHVESIFFPLSGSAPGGTYKISVNTHQQRGTADRWLLQVLMNGQPIMSESGVGTRDDIVYVREDERPPGEMCSKQNPQIQCCQNLDCFVGESKRNTCDNRQCITQIPNGFRFTLSYYGNDIYALGVYTPDDVLVYQENPYDSISDGFFEDDRNRNFDGTTWRTQNIYFPADAPAGEYVFFVDLWEQKGLIVDEWDLTVWDGTGKFQVEKGSGNSIAFSYLKALCTTSDECGEDEICISQYCIFDGSPRFTLQWEGEDDLDIIVQTPQGHTIDYFHRFDPASSGFIQDDELYSRNHVEAITFQDPNAVPVGTYQIKVLSYWTKDPLNPNPWKVTVDDQGEQVRVWEGLGDTETGFLTWNFSGVARTTGPTPPPTSQITSRPSSPPTPAFCFSGENWVVTRDRGKVQLKELRVGDMILTPSDDFEPVYGFGHFSESQEAEFLQILPSQLEISADHMILVESGRSVPSSSLKAGDRLLNGETISEIKIVRRHGVYAPFTPSGKLIVSGNSVSSYVAFQSSEVLLLAGFRTPLRYQWLAHTFLFPRRYWCTYLASCSEERYTEDGVATWAVIPLRFARWLLGGFDSGSVVAVLLFVPVLVLPLMLSLLELSLFYQALSLSLLAVGLYLLFVFRCFDRMRAKHCSLSIR